MIHEKRREMKNKIAAMFEKNIPGLKIPKEFGWLVTDLCTRKW